MIKVVLILIIEKRLLNTFILLCIVPHTYSFLTLKGLYLKCLCFVYKRFLSVNKIRKQFLMSALYFLVYLDSIEITKYFFYGVITQIA